jgi:hypothetical protein
VNSLLASHMQFPPASATKYLEVSQTHVFKPTFQTLNLSQTQLYEGVTVNTKYLDTSHLQSDAAVNTRLLIAGSQLHI